MAGRVLLAALVVTVLAGTLSAAPASLAKRERPKTEPPFDLLKQEFAAKCGFHVQEVRQEGSRWLVKCSNADGNYVVAFTVNNAPTCQAALRKLIDLYRSRQLLPPQY
jgi:hypothetical protein